MIWTAAAWLIVAVAVLPARLVTWLLLPHGLFVRMWSEPGLRRLSCRTGIHMNQEPNGLWHERCRDCGTDWSVL